MKVVHKLPVESYTLISVLCKATISSLLHYEIVEGHTERVVMLATFERCRCISFKGENQLLLLVAISGKKKS